MNIDKYINDLLFFYDLVIIPEFGGFIANYKSATIEKTNFTPPSKSVMFNSDLKTNDGLLLNAIINHEKISQEDAKQKITEFTTSIFKQINNNNIFIIENVGFFKKSKNNDIVFEPELKTNFLLSSYGLDKFSAPILESQLQKKFKSGNVANNWISSKMVKQLAVGVPLALLLTLIPSKSNLVKNLSSFNVFQTYSAIEKALPYDSIIANSNSIDNTLNEITKNKSALYFTEEKNKSKEKPIVSENVSPKITETPKAKSTKNKKELKESINKTSLKKYQLISGSFKNEQNAQKRLIKLRKSGLNPILNKKKNRYRIIANSFDTRDDAKTEVVKLKNKKISCWIYTSK